MRKKVLIVVGIILFLCLAASTALLFRTYWYGLNRFQGASAVQEYLRANLTPGKSTLTETQRFMQAAIYGGVRCGAALANATVLDCKVDGMAIGCNQRIYRIHYVFRDEILADFTVEDRPGICL